MVKVKILLNSVECFWGRNFPVMVVFLCVYITFLCHFLISLSFGFVEDGRRIK